MSIYSNIENDNLELFLCDFDEVNLLDYLFFAVEYKAYVITHYILNKYNLANTYKEVFGKSLMTLACENNDVEMLKLLLKNNENINGNPLSLFNPLEISVIDRKNEVFLELLRNGADVNFFLPRHNRTILDTALMYEKFENFDYSSYINELKKNKSISTRDYSVIEKNSTNFKKINEYFGNILNYSFKFKEFLNTIYIGFFDKNTNYIFIERDEVVYIVFLPFDWPLNNQDDYLKTNYSFFFNFINFFSLNSSNGIRVC